MNSEQQLALDDVLKGLSVFITGGAGVGKSYLVNVIVKTIKNQIGVCAMTGCAALLINGTTLHSYLGIGLATESALQLANKVRRFPAVFERILELETLLIDEVSMLNDELFEKVSEFLQIIRKSKKPFGGVQMIFVGDPFQLCPVEGDYCFTSYIREMMNGQGFNEDEINKVRDKARLISVQLNMEKEFGKLNRLISALLKTKSSKIIISPLAKARAFGMPYDPSRVDLFEILFRDLKKVEFPFREEKNTSPTSFRNFAFFESYFSNSVFTFI